MKKNKKSLHDEVNDLQRKFAWSLLVRDEVLKLVKSAYCQGGDDTHKLLTKK